MSQSRQAVRSLTSLRLGRRTLYIVPFRGIAYAFASLVIVFVIMLVVDRVVLGSLERAGWTSGELWARHNKLVEENHRRKTTTNECQLRHWTGQPLSTETNRRKILVLGDSFVWGPPYTTLNHLWWRQLAIELERRGHREVDVVAVGHPGWSTRRQLECAKQLIPEIKPDLVIWGYVTNDPDEKIVPQIFDSQDQPPYGQRIHQQLKWILPNLAFKFESLRADKLAAQYTGPEYGYAYPDWELKLVDGENFERYRDTIQEVSAFIRQAKIPAFLHTLPHFPSREYFEPRYAPVLKEWQAAGVVVNNTLDEFVRRYGTVSPTGPAALRWGINPSDSHPRPKATHFHAVTAADFLEQMWPAVLGPKDESRPHELAINDWMPYDLNVRQTDGQTFELHYPATTSFMPQPPGDEPTAMVALRFPLPFDELRLDGLGLVGGRIWISLTDPKEHFDEDRWLELRKFTGDSFADQIPRDLVGRELTQVRFNAAIQGPDRRLRLTLIRHAAAKERPIMARILGISAFYHDSAAALIDNGNILGAAQEERFTRIKGDASFPYYAIGWCLDNAGITIDEVDHVVFYEQPVVKFERLLTSYLATAPRGLPSFLTSMPSWLTNKLWLEREIARELGIRRRIWFCTHHLSHAASAFFPSPFEEAAILTIDGVGEWSTATWGIGRGSRIELSEEMRFPNSLGLLYSAFTYYCGFKINSGEYKLMGLAPYGQPRYKVEILDKVIRLHDDGSVVLNQDYFNYVTGLTMTSEPFHRLFGGPPRQPESKITQREMDLAASVQAVIDEAILRMGRYVHQRTGLDQLALAGGVALNCVATGRLSSEGPFRSLWTQPAAGDAGGALGAALWFWHHKLKQPRTMHKPDAMRGSFLGPEIDAQSANDDAMLCRLGAVWENLSDSDLQVRIADSISGGKVVAVARGSMEFGPRALGARSILGDARSDSMQSHMNLKIKFREGFRPFAPMVLAEDADRYFAARQESPYMLLVYPVQEQHRRHVAADGKFGFDLLKLPRSNIPSVTHVDYSARVQTVDASRNPFMHAVLSRFRDRTGCSVIVNTSFNVRGEPIVNTVEDAYRCFMATEIDCLVVGNRFLERDRQQNRPLNDHERANWLRRFELD